MTITNMKRIPVVVTTTMIALVFALVATQQSTEAATLYKVYVRLGNVDKNFLGYYNVRVTIGEIIKTKFRIDVGGGQICPDDIMVACYKETSAFIFGQTKKGLVLEVCAEPIVNYDIQCTNYTTNGKASQTVSVQVPDYQSTGKQKIYNGGEFMDENANFPSQ